MADNKAKEPTAREKVALRIGPCAAVVCSYGCIEFAYSRNMDGYRICVCGHTQHTHTRGASA